MLIAQMDGLELRPYTSELVRDLMAVLLLGVPFLVVTALVVRVKRPARRRDDLEARTERLAESLVGERDPKR